MQKNIILFLFLFIYSCNNLPNSLGKDNEIIVIVSPQDKDYIEGAVDDLFGHKIYTPQPENEFVYNYKSPWDIKSVNNYANILILSLDFPQDSTGDLLMKRILNSHNQDESLFVIENWQAKNQILCGIHTLDALSMNRKINHNKNWILSEFRNRLYNTMKSNIYKYGKNQILSKKIMNIFNYTLDLQPDLKTRLLLPVKITKYPAYLVSLQIHLIRRARSLMRIHMTTSRKRCLKIFFLLLEAVSHKKLRFSVL